MPLMVLTASSTLSVTSLSTCSGAAPGKRVVTVMVGKSTVGMRSTPSWPNANAPTTTSERIRTEAKTGRRTQSSASHCMTHLFRGDAYAVGQLRDAAGRDLLACFQTTGDLDEIADRLTDCHDALFGFVAGDDEHPRRAGHGAYRCGRRQNAGTAIRLLDQCGGERTGLQRALVIGHDRFDDQRARVGLECGRHVAH